VLLLPDTTTLATPEAAVKQEISFAPRRREAGSGSRLASALLAAAGTAPGVAIASLRSPPRDRLREQSLAAAGTAEGEITCCSPPRGRTRLAALRREAGSGRDESLSCSPPRGRRWEPTGGG
jgi:hypothetical protein